MKQAIRVGWLLVIALVVGTGFWFTARYAPVEPSELLERPWIDHLPTHEREPFRVYLFSRSRQGNDQMAGGYLLAESSYKAHGELFSHVETEREITVTFLHDNVKAVTAYRLERIPPDKDDMDLKLTLARDPRQNGKASIFYSSSEWGSGHMPAVLSHIFFNFQ